MLGVQLHVPLLAPFEGLGGSEKSSVGLQRGAAEGLRNSVLWGQVATGISACDVLHCTWRLGHRQQSNFHRSGRKATESRVDRVGVGNSKKSG